MSFCTLSDLKQVLRIPDADTSQDVMLTSIVEAANSEILGLFNLTDTAPTTYTNTYDVIDAYSRGIYLNQYPVISVTTLTVDENVVDPSKYYLKNPARFGLISGKDDNFYQSIQKIEVEHVAGFTTIPPALKRGVIVLAVSMYNLEAKTGYRSEKIGQYSYVLGSPAGGMDGSTAGDFPAQTRRALSQYLRPFAESY